MVATTRSQIKSSKRTSYIFQKRNYYPYHCGPIALFNLLSRLNISTNLENVFSLGNPIKPCGINKHGLNVFVKNINSKYNLNIKEHCSNIELIESKLSNGNVGILLFCEDPNKYYGHFALVEKYSSNKYLIINYSTECETNIVSKKTLEKLIKYKKEFGKSIFWSCDSI